MTDEEKIARRIACPQAGYPLYEARYATERAWREENGCMFKSGDQLVYINLPGYHWVADFIDTDLIQTVVEVYETDGSVFLKLEDIITHKIPIPAFCFDYEDDKK